MGPRRSSVDPERAVRVLWMCQRKALSSGVPSENDNSLREPGGSMASLSISSKVSAGQAGHEFAQSSSESFWQVPASNLPSDEKDLCKQQR